MVSENDENNDLLSRYRSILTLKGYNVLILRENIFAAIERLLAAREKPDIVIIDGSNRKENYSASIKKVNCEFPEIEFVIVADDKELEKEINDKGAECVFKNPRSLMAILRKRF
ncbi:hypothetical protein CUJ83_14940 [Methanocella sp. CWC-04]|uniref:Uncharacterized protein n=1 Tax=Methanooceanicella nereidis TaxID=2052831 RepID=A0AAP2RHG1_9EURY|nr:hypothetical protein [Methanocella sp. CWC-04]MCD1296297.1 hypothetical protein [Methanocella sp. CWC-04]